MRTLLALIAVVALAGCKKTSSTSPEAKAYADGSERGACYGNKTCNDGLVCLSQLCVRPPGADCAKVVAHLSSILLDNYTPRPQREAFTSATTGQCIAAGLTMEDGDCLLQAPHRNVLNKCPKVIGVGDCAKIVPYVQALPGNDPNLKTDADRVVDRCKNETPSMGFETCVMIAQKVSDLARCAW